MTRVKGRDFLTFVSAVAAVAVISFNIDGPSRHPSAITRRLGSSSSVGASGSVPSRHVTPTTQREYKLEGKRILFHHMNDILDALAGESVDNDDETAVIGAESAEPRAGDVANSRSTDRRTGPTV
jgi:hypothetical protein